MGKCRALANSIFSSLFKRRARIFIFLALFVFVALGAWGADYTWTGGAGTDWRNAGNWSVVPAGSGSYPGDGGASGDTVTIPGGATSYPILQLSYPDPDITIASLIVNETAEVTINSTGNFTVTGLVDNAGKIIIKASTANAMTVGALHNKSTGIIEVHGNEWGSAGNLDVTGTLSNDSGGTINVKSGGSLTANTLNNDGSIIVNNDGASVAGPGNLDVTGDIDNTGGSIDVTDGGSLAAGGSVSGGENITTDGSSTIPEDGFTWTGVTSNAWTETTNWSGDIVPVAGSNVIIPNLASVSATGPYYPVLIDDIDSVGVGVGGIASLIVKSGAKLTIGSSSTRDISVTGKIDFQSGSTLELNQSVHLRTTSASSTITFASGSTITPAGESLQFLELWASEGTIDFGASVGVGGFSLLHLALKEAAIVNITSTGMNINDTVTNSDIWITSVESFTNEPTSFDGLRVTVDGTTNTVLKSSITCKIFSVKTPSISLTNDVVIETTESGNISFTNATINSGIGGPYGLTLTAGTVTLNGAVGNSAPLSKLTVTTGTTNINTTSIRAGEVSFGGEVVLSDNVTIMATGVGGTGGINFVDAIVGPKNLTLSATGSVTLDTAWGIGALNVTGNDINLKGNIQVQSGDLVFNSPVILKSLTILLNAYQSNITFNTAATINSVTGTASNLILDVEKVDGQVILKGAVGSSDPLKSLTIEVMQTSAVGAPSVTRVDAITIGENIITTENILFKSPVTLNPATTIEISTGTGVGNITFADKIAGTGKDLKLIAGTGDVTLGGEVGTVGGDLTTLNIDSATNVNINANVNAVKGNFKDLTGTLSVSGADFLSTVDLTFVDSDFALALASHNQLNCKSFSANAATKLTLGQNTTIVTTGADGIDFSTTTSTIDGEHTLTLNATNGKVILNGAVGATPLSSLTVIATGTPDAITIGANIITTGAVIFTGDTSLGANVTTAGGNVTFNSPVTLSANPIAVSTGAGAAAGDITFEPLATINGTTANTQALNLTAGTGTVTLSGDVGNLAVLTTLTVSGGTIEVQKTVTTTGAIVFTGSTGIAIAVGENITSGTGDITFTGNTSLGANVTTTGGNVTFKSPVTLAAIGLDFVTITTITSGDITFASTIDGTVFFKQKLTLNAEDGTVTLGGMVGGNVPLKSLNFSHAIKIYIGGNITIGSISSTGNILFEWPVILIDDVIIATTNAYITFENTIDSLTVLPSHYSLTLSAGGGNDKVTLGGEVGGAGALSALTVSAANTGNDAIKIGANVTTAGGNVTFNSPVTLNPATTATMIEISTGSGTGKITFESTITGANKDLKLIADTGNVTLSGEVGTVAGDLTTLNIDSATNVNINANVFAVKGNFKDLTGKLSVRGADFLSTVDLTFEDSNFTLALDSHNQLKCKSFSANATTKLTLSQTTIIATTGADGIDFSTDTSTINGGHTLTLNATNGKVILNGAVGATPLASLTVIATGTPGTITVGANIITMGAVIFTGDTSLGANVTTTGGDVTFKSPVTLSVTATNPIAISTGAGALAGDITFEALATINGAKELTLTAGAGTVTLSGDVGNSALLSKLAVSGGTISVQKTVTTTGVIAFTGSATITVNAPANIKSTGTGDITFSGNTNLGANVTANNGNIDFDSPVTLISTVEIATTGTGTGNITFSSTITGTQALTLAASTSTVTLNGVVGATPLSKLTVSGGTISVKETVTTTGAISFTGSTGIAVDVGANIKSTGTGAFVTFDGTTSLGANVTTTGGNVTFKSPVTLSATAINSIKISTGAGAGNITFATLSTINGATANTQALNLTAGTGTVTLSGDVGNSAVLTTLTVSGGTITVQKTVTTTGAIDFDGVTIITVGEGATIKNTGIGATVTFDGNTSLGANVTTTGGDVTFNSPVTLSATPITISTGTGTGADITFNATLDGRHSLAVNAGTKNVLFNGAVGSTNPLDALSVNASVIDIHSSVITSGIQDFNPDGREGSIVRHLAGADRLWEATLVDLSKIDLYIDIGTFELTIVSNVTCKNLYFYNGKLNIRASTITTAEDFVVFGSDYDPNDSGWTPALNARYAYYGTNSLVYKPSGGTYDTSTGYFSPAPSAAFTNLANSTITVNGNFYNNGADMNAGAFTLNIPNRGTTAFEPNFTNTVTEFQWGVPYALAFNMTVTNSTAVDGWVAADTTEQKVLDGPPTGTNVNWYFSGADGLKLESISTIADNQVQLEFSVPINTSDSSLVRILDNVKFYPDGNPSNSIKFTNVVPNADKTILTFTTTHTWNTDTVGMTINALSTNRHGDFTGTTNVISSFQKGVFYALDVPVMGQEYVTNTLSNIDKCSPVLIGTYTGQEMHDTTISTQKQYDAHNFIEFQYSEPVTIGNADLDGTTKNTNIRATATLGHIPNNTSGTNLEVAGLATIATGTLTTGTRDSNSHANSLYRNFSFTPVASAANQTHRVRVSIAGYVDGTSTSSHNWIGYTDRATTPSGIITPLAGVKDIANNPLALNGDAFDPPVIKVNDSPPVYSLPTTGIYGDWDTSPPVFAKYVPDKATWTNFSNEKEIAGYSSTGYFVESMEFHFFDNTPAYTAIDTYQWLSDGGWHNADTYIAGSKDDTYGGSRFIDPNRTIGGIRTSSLEGSLDAFTITDTAQIDIVISGIFSQTVQNTTLFGSGGDTGATDGLYLSLPLVDTKKHRLDKTFNISYNGTTGFVTDLAGNRLKTTDVTSIHIPHIVLTVAPVGMTEMYVLFSTQIETGGTALSDMPKNLITIGTGATLPAINQAVPARIVSDTSAGTGFIITLTEAVEYVDIIDNQVLSIRSRVVDPSLSGIKRKGTSIYAQSQVYPLSTFAVNVVNPLYAFDNKLLEDGSTGIQGDGLFGEGEWAVRLFDGSGTSLNSVVAGEDITLGLVGDGIPTGSTVKMFLDIHPTPASISTEFNLRTRLGSRVWIPSPTVIPAISETPNTRNDIKIIPIEFPKTVLPFASLYNWKAGDQVQFMFEMNGVTIDHDSNTSTAPIPLYALRLKDPTDPSSIDLWSLDISAITQQRGNVTILNNVINTNIREKLRIEVAMPSDGNLSVQVLTLDGNVVKSLQRGRASKGVLYYTWDGTNNAGDSVVRGMYFVRVVGPGIDETRKVIAIKE